MGGHRVKCGGDHAVTRPLFAPVKRLPFRRHHVLGVTWVVLSAVAMLLPALRHGFSLGPYDILTNSGLLSTSRTAISGHSAHSGDLVNEIIPWSTLAWTQVHHGHLPLWNPYSGLGTPLAFNWQSAPFGLPALVGYLVPLRMAYTIGLLTTLLIAGLGTYLLGRVLGLGAIACAMAATIFELSGPLTGWLGYPLGSVMAFAGWMFAAALLVVRGRNRACSITFLAVTIALAVYAGNPESLFVLALALIVFVIVLLVPRFHLPLRNLTALRPVVDLAIAAGAGLLLAAPLALPGAQLATGTTRTTLGGSQGLSVGQALLSIFPPGFRAQPLTLTIGGVPFPVGDHVSLTIGVIALSLVFASWVGTRMRIEVIAFAATAVVSAGLVFLRPMQVVFDVVPFAKTIYWSRMLMPLGFCLALLAGFGTDALIRSHRQFAVRRWFELGLTIFGLVVLGVWLFDRQGLLPAAAANRTRSFVWPVVGIAVGVVAVGVLHRFDRSTRRPHPLPTSATVPVAGLGVRHWVAFALLAFETAFLVSMAAPEWSASSTFPPSTAAVVALQRSVGTATVGFGEKTTDNLCPDLGVPPESNVLYGIHEINIYDPVIPRSYFRSWLAATGNDGGTPLLATFCPDVASTTVARLFGVGYVLVPHGHSGPTGSVLVDSVGNEDLYRIPGAAPATLTPVATDAPLPGTNAPGKAVTVTHPSPATWKVTTQATTPEVLRLRITDVPGWHATIDGQPLALSRFSGVMLQARIPAGRHVIEASYWPSTFTLGLVLALISATGLTAGLLVAWQSRLKFDVTSRLTVERQPSDRTP
jgi:Bacterial membrane protein YfhO